MTQTKFVVLSIFILAIVILIVTITPILLFVHSNYLVGGREEGAPRAIDEHRNLYAWYETLSHRPREGHPRRKFSEKSLQCL